MTAGNEFLRNALAAADQVETAEAGPAEKSRPVAPSSGEVMPGGGVSAAFTTGGTSGGGYRFDAEEIAAKITQMEGFRDRSRDIVAQLESGAQACTPPANDPPSRRQAEAARNSMIAASKHAASMVAYADALIDALRKANGTYVEKEADTADALKGAAPEEDLGVFGT